MSAGPERPAWWTEEDEAILRGETAKLAELRRPIYTERSPDDLEYHPLAVRRSARIQFAMVLAAWFALVLAMIWLSVTTAGRDDPGPYVTPTPVPTPVQTR